jgi:FkbM family methyltransferase
MLRFGKFLCNEARLDRVNDFATNGERRLQSELAHLARSRSNCTILDVGANIGEWSQLLAQEFGGDVDYTIHAFEPCKGTFATLKENLRLRNLTKQVIPCNVALSSNECELPFYSLGDNVGCNSLYLYPHWEKKPVVETIRCRTLDGWCEENHIDRVFFMKMDTEGNEVEVLNGAKSMLEASKIEMLQFEYNHMWIHARHFLRDVFELLGSFGFTIGKITRKGIVFFHEWHPDLETFVEGNYLAVKPKYLSAFTTCR